MQLAKNTEIVIASHNQGKIREIRDLLSHFAVKISSAADYGLNDPEETETTFEGNALLKARYVAEKTGKIALADDSGLAVEALNGDPGIYSARWAGETKDFNMAMNRIEQEWLAQETDNTTARFFCALAWIDPLKNIEKVFLGQIKGTLTFPPRGEKGFGYDPIFTADGMTQTFAEIDPIHKHSISHRADAFRQLVHFLSA